MSETQKRTAGKSFLYKLLESTGTQGISLLVGIVLARLLSPTDYGVLSLLLVFVNISRVFVQSGLNTALIQRLKVEEADLSAVFTLSLGIAGGLYAILFAAAPAIAGFYALPELTALMRVLALILFPGALQSVQQAVIAREMAFQKLMVASIAANLTSGAVGVGMAYAGCGVWALIGQQLVSQVLVCVILLFTVAWRPRLLFAWSRVRSLFSFGWKLLLSSLIETVYNNLRTLVIGKLYPKAQVGFYDRGRQFPELLMNNVNGSIQSVMLPMFAAEQQNQSIRHTVHALTGEFKGLPTGGPDCFHKLLFDFILPHPASPPLPARHRCVGVSFPGIPFSGVSFSGASSCALPEPHCRWLHWLSGPGGCG